MDWETVAPLLAVAAVGGIILGVLLSWLRARMRKATVSSVCRHMREEAERDAQQLLQQAEVRIKSELYEKREAFEQEAQEIRKELKEQERRLTKRDDAIERREAMLETRDTHLEARELKLLEKEQEIQQDRERLAEVLEKQTSKLAEIGGLKPDAARERLLAMTREQIAGEESELVQRMIERVEEQSEERARWVVTQAIHRIASEHTTEHTATTIGLPSDDVKGRIIGREGRNIRAFEKATGVDVIVDDTPGVVSVSTFDSVRREIAQRALQKLIADGRIHPARIEEVVRQTRKDIEKQIAERGKEVMYETDVHRIHPKLQYHLGRLMFRTSYGQNVLLHSIEVSHLMGIMAGELGLDVKLAKRCGLLHDVGKALDQEQEGGHPEIGAELAERYKEAPEVIDAIRHHHSTAKAKTIWPVLTSAADAISASRPGARRDTFERYIQRLEKLEEVATRHSGVSQAYAIQAGRELRVIVNEHDIDDAKALALAREIASDIEGELTYPGEIRVTLIRETRVVEHAR